MQNSQPTWFQLRFQFPYLTTISVANRFVNFSLPWLVNSPLCSKHCQSFIWVVSNVKPPVSCVFALHWLNHVTWILTSHWLQVCHVTCFSLIRISSVRIQCTVHICYLSVVLTLFDTDHLLMRCRRLKTCSQGKRGILNFRVGISDREWKLEDGQESLEYTTLER